MKLTPNSIAGSWQEKCTIELIRCASLGHQAWADSKKALQFQDRVILADADFGGADLRKFDFSRCYIARVNFRNANLQKTSFYQSIVKQTYLTKSDIRGANFKDAEVSTTNFYKVIWDKTTNLDWASQLSEHNQLRPAFRQAVEEHRYLSDMNGTGIHFGLKIWNAATKYGTSATRLLLISFAINIVLGFVYYGISKIDKNLFQPANEYSLLQFIVSAFQRFLNSSTTIDAGHTAVSFLLMFNSLLGFIVLGIFAALISKRLIALPS